MGRRSDEGGGARPGRRAARRTGRSCLLGLLALGGTVLVAPHLAGAATARSRAGGASQGVPFELINEFPRAGRTGVPGTTRIVLTFSHRLAGSGPLPTITPATPGRWTRTWNHLIFVPTVAFAPDTTVTVTVPRGAASPLDLGGGRVVRSIRSSFTVSNGSILRAEQLLAELDYLPVEFVPASPVPLGTAAAARAAFVAPPGHFTWNWAAPAPLRQEFAGRASPTLLRGALLSLERLAGLPESGQLGAAEWRVLLRESRAPSLFASPVATPTPSPRSPRRSTSPSGTTGRSW